MEIIQTAFNLIHLIQSENSNAEEVKLGENC